MKKFLLSIFTLCMAVTAWAQPSNDNCADAQMIALDDVLEYTTVDANTDGPLHPDISCFGENDSIPKDIWFVFTPDVSQAVIVSNCGTSGDFDSRMVIYQAGLECGDLTPETFLECNDDGSGADCGVGSAIGFVPEAGATYLIRLGGFGDDMGNVSEGSGTITVTVANGPDNDFCAAALPVELGENQAYNTTDALTDGPDHPDNPCFGFGSLTAGADIWYTFTPDFTGAVNWSTCNTGGFDTRLAVYEPGSPCPPADEDLYSCNDDGAGCAGFTSDLNFEVEAGMTYLLRLGGFNNESGAGSFSLIETTPPMPPVNDACEDFIEVNVINEEQAATFQFLEQGTTEDATFVSADFVFPPCLANQNGGEFADVWYRFNNQGLSDVRIDFYNLEEAETAQFFLNLMDDCGTLVDTMVIQNSCGIVNATEDAVEMEVTGLADVPTDYYVRVLTRLTSDAPGLFGFQIIGDVDIIDNTEETSFVEAARITPNPAQSLAVLNLELVENVNLYADLINAVGQTVRTQDFGRLGTGSHGLPLDIAGVAPGLYLVNLHSDAGMKTLKLLVE